MAEAYGQLPCVFRHLSQEDLNFCRAVHRVARAERLQLAEQRIADGWQGVVTSGDAS